MVNGTAAVAVLNVGLPLSNAVAVAVWLPAASPVALKLYGDVVSLDTSAPSTRNSTRMTAPPGSAGRCGQCHRGTRRERLTARRRGECHGRRGIARAGDREWHRCRDRAQCRAAVVHRSRGDGVTSRRESRGREGVRRRSVGVHQSAVDTELDANYCAAGIGGICRQVDAGGSGRERLTIGRCRHRNRGRRIARACRC